MSDPYNLFIVPIHKNNETNDKFLPESSICYVWKWLILDLNAEKQLRNKNHIEDWALGCQRRDNGHVTY